MFAVVESENPKAPKESLVTLAASLQWGDPYLGTWEVSIQVHVHGSEYYGSFIYSQHTQETGPLLRKPEH